MVEPEVAFATLEDIIELSEDLILFILERVLERNKNELDVLERNTLPLETIKKPFPRVTYEDILPKFQEKGSPIKWGMDLGAFEESILPKIYDSPVCITNFPTAIKAFYMQPDAQRPDTVLGIDVMASEGYGELIGGGQRIHDPKLLEQRIKEHNLPREDYKWYLDLRRYGSVPHSGFGLGVERMLSWICKIQHIRETIPFPRLLYKIYP
jgi:asparaginyl-tRNA synthetase